MINNDWISLDETVITPEVNAIFCDTRDFHVALRSIEKLEKVEDDPYSNHTLNPMIDLIEKGNIDEKYFIEECDILPFFNKIREIKKYSQTLVLRFNNVENCSFWVKYVRLYKLDNGKYLVTNDCRPIEWRLLSTENVEK